MGLTFLRLSSGMHSQFDFCGFLTTLTLVKDRLFWGNDCLGSDFNVELPLRRLTKVDLRERSFA